MNIPATNKTAEEVVLAGATIAPSSQVSIRAELISQEEITEIKESGATLIRNANGYIVSDAEDKTEDSAELNDKKEAEVKTVAHVTYPEKYINKKGNLNGSNVAKSAIEKLKEEHENIVSDNEFKELYPSTDPSGFRVDDIGGE